MGGARESSGAEVVIPRRWEEAAEAIARGGCAEPPVALVCGPKNSGKSTFSRYLLNALLPRYGRVGYLDTDVGQPEFGLPGCLSLHIIDEHLSDLSSPSFRAPERCHLIRGIYEDSGHLYTLCGHGNPMCLFFGDVSSKRDPQAYLNHIFSLYDCFIKEYHQSNEGDSFGKSMLPLIINTPGWVKGIGYDLLVDVLRYTCPTQVVQIRISVESKNLPTGAFWLEGDQKRSFELIEISSARKDSANRSVLVWKDARGMRDRRLFEYFKQCFPSNLNIGSNKELAYALASLPPYEVSSSGIKIMHLHCQVPNTEIFHSLNATIVALAVSSGGPVISQGCSPLCAGLGIVRGVDDTKGLLYVITPIPHSILENVDLLLQGFIEIPTGLLQARGCVSPYMSMNVLHRLPEKILCEVTAE